MGIVGSTVGAFAVASTGVTAEVPLVVKTVEGSSEGVLAETTRTTHDKTRPRTGFMIGQSSERLDSQSEARFKIQNSGKKNTKKMNKKWKKIQKLDLK